MQSYRELLADPRWQKKRLEILSRDKFTCQRCGETTKPLHVHHNFYLPKKAPWEYNNGALKTLCDECHSITREEQVETSGHLGDLLIYVFNDDINNLLAALTFPIDMEYKEKLQVLTRVAFDRELMHSLLAEIKAR